MIYAIHVYDDADYEEYIVAEFASLNEAEDFADSFVLTEDIIYDLYPIKENSFSLEALQDAFMDNMDGFLAEYQEKKNLTF